MQVGDRILVTGSNGFVGQHLCARIAASRPDAGLTRAGGPGGAPSDVVLDVSNADAVDALVRQVKPTAVIHLAAISAVADAGGDPRRAWAVNTGGALNLALSLKQHAPEAALLFISTAEVYGAGSADIARFTEESPLAPLNAYAASKAAAEIALMQLARDGLKTLIARPFNHSGPGQSPAFVLPAFAQQIAQIEAGLREPVIKVGDLDAERDFLDVRDVVSAYLAILERAGQLPAGAVFNIASGRMRPIRALLDLMQAQARRPITIEVDPTRQRRQAMRRVGGDAAKALRLLGWSPAIPIEETIASILDWWRREISPS